MKIHQIDIYQEFNAPVEVVWEAMNDHSNFGKMMGLTMVRIVDSADNNNLNGVGSVRLIKAPLFDFEETIVKSEKPTCIEYRISRGTPLNHHYGKMDFKSLDKGKSALKYNITVGSKFPFIGGIVKNGLEQAIKKSLKKYADRLEK